MLWQVLYELKTDAKWEGVVTAVSSRTDEPNWAQECMRKFEVGPPGSGLCIKDCIDVEEISKTNKRDHFKRISDATGIAYEEILFFDNERPNCLDVSDLGVSVAYVPDGVTGEAWEESLERFPEPGSVFDFRMGR